MRYDTVIIGAGMSGLSAGVRLAYYEKKVCILERHTTIGGLNSSIVSANATTMSDCMPSRIMRSGHEAGPLSKLLRQLRMTWEDFDLRPQLKSTVVFPRVRLQFTNDFSVFLDQVVTAFPLRPMPFRDF